MTYLHVLFKIYIFTLITFIVCSNCLFVLFSNHLNPYLLVKLLLHYLHIYITKTLQNIFRQGKLLFHRKNSIFPNRNFILDLNPGYLSKNEILVLKELF